LKFRRLAHVDEEGIPITNLVDVLFLLIVFFMLSTVLSFDRGLNAKLAETKNSVTISNKGISLLIDRNGKIFINGAEIAMDKLGETVRKMRETEGQNVILKSDRDTRYQVIATVMDKLLEAGVSDVSMPTLELGR
jgi:biopolymer transport protein ExbD